MTKFIVCKLNELYTFWHVDKVSMQQLELLSKLENVSETSSLNAGHVHEVSQQIKAMEEVCTINTVSQTNQQTNQML